MSLAMCLLELQYHNHMVEIISAAFSVAKDCQLCDKTPLLPSLPAKASIRGRLVNDFVRENMCLFIFKRRRYPVFN